MGRDEIIKKLVKKCEIYASIIDFILVEALEIENSEVANLKTKGLEMGISEIRI